MHGERQAALVSMAVFVSICLAFTYSKSVLAVDRRAEPRNPLNSFQRLKISKDIVSFKAPEKVGFMSCLLP